MFFSPKRLQIKVPTRLPMKIVILQDPSEINWKTVSLLLKEAGMAWFEPEKHQKAFESSHTAVFAMDGERLIGCGRALSDGVYQAALYDIAVLPEYQGKGVGRLILEALLARVGHCNVILYATPGKEPFYHKLGLRRMKTGMAHFIKAEAMAQKGFTE
jgi:GNAT superfamily N-acetyltransferase